MSIFNVISLLGGLALFLYGMRMMSGGLKESSSGTLKKILEKVTNNTFKAFLLGVIVTATIQSSTATIVITSGLVAAGLIGFKQSIGIIMGANVGTTVTGQIIRLLDVDSSSTAWLEVFKPSTLAPVALIVGIILVMFMKFKNSDSIGVILLGFGILFTGLMNMTNSVSVLSDSGAFDKLFAGLGNSPLLGYLTGAGVATVLQSSSATIGILQAFSTTGLLQFRSIYAVLVGIYLGDCLTTAFVCSIGAKSEAKRVGVANILFNLSETVLVFIGIAIAKATGLLDPLWNSTVNSGIIANTNTIFNLGCSMLLFPLSGLFVKLSYVIVKDEPVEKGKYDEYIDELNPVFFKTPALAFRSCYDALKLMLNLSADNIEKAFDNIENYSEEIADEVKETEKNVDMLADKISSYLVSLSPNIKEDKHVRILDNYYKVVTEFERLSDHAVNIIKTSQALKKDGQKFSDQALSEIKILENILDEIISYAKLAFEKRDVVAAKHIEPLEEVVDDLVSTLRNNHLKRMREGKCDSITDVEFTNLMSDMERISDVCSNIGVATVARVEFSAANSGHEYISLLHSGRDESFNAEYDAAHLKYFNLLSECEK